VCKVNVGSDLLRSKASTKKVKGSRVDAPKQGKASAAGDMAVDGAGGGAGKIKLIKTSK
jgi:hypothetical protein